MVFLIVLINCVIFKVEQDEYVVIGNSFTMQFHKEILSQGIYFLGPATYLIKFKRTLQSIELGELECLTQDEVMLYIHVSTQFQYEKDSLIPVILNQFDTDLKYKEFLRAAMRSSIIGTCLQFTALEYYEERAKVDAQMNYDLKTNINGQNMGSSIEYFQLVDIIYPQEYTAILHQKQNVKQDLITAENNRATEVINAHTAQMEAQRTANINLVNAKNYYDITIYNANAQKKAVDSQWDNREKTYLTVMTNLGYTQEQLISYLKADVVRTSKVISGIK
jgi:regulator of protease activity HflC (stomatin/prohibitin superfamily)